MGINRSEKLKPDLKSAWNSKSTPGCPTQSIDHECYLQNMSTVSHLEHGLMKNIESKFASLLPWGDWKGGREQNKGLFFRELGSFVNLLLSKSLRLKKTWESSCSKLIAVASKCTQFAVAWKLETLGKQVTKTFSEHSGHFSKYSFHPETLRVTCIA